MRAALAAVVAAALYSLAAPPYGWSLLGWAVPGVLLASARRLAPRWAFLLGVVFTLFLGFGMTRWTFHATLLYFGTSRILAGAFVVGLWLACGAIPYGLLLGAYAGLAPRVAGWLRAPLAAWLWVAAERLRATLFTGMPWELLGHTQYRARAIVQVADLGGVYAVSFVMALVSTAVAEAVSERQKDAGMGRLALPATVLAATLAYGAWARHVEAADGTPPATRTVAIVQGNIANEFRWKQSFVESMLTTYARLSNVARATHPDLLVWPENAANFYLNREPLLLAQLGPVAAIARDGLLLGAPRLTDDGEARNAAYLVDPAGAIAATYDKRRLVPLAEYDPFAHTAEARASGPIFTPGAEGQILRTATMRLGVVICYEVLFPGLVADVVRKGADVLVNVSNDSWLDPGDGAAPQQHFSMAVFRAIETRRFLVRAAATGVSGFITPDGDIYGTLPRSRAGTQAARVELRRGLTPYVRWGDAWMVVLGCAIVGTALTAAGRAPR